MNSHLIGLEGLCLVADAACELDAYKDHLAGPERERIKHMLDELHDLVVRVAGPAAVMIYAPDDDTPSAHDTNAQPAITAQG